MSTLYTQRYSHMLISMQIPGVIGSLCHGRGEIYELGQSKAALGRIEKYSAHGRSPAEEL